MNKVEFNLMLYRSPEIYSIEYIVFPAYNCFTICVNLRIHKKCESVYIEFNPVAYSMQQTVKSADISYSGNVDFFYRMLTETHLWDGLTASLSFL